MVGDVLLEQESILHDLPFPQISAPENITAGDGGEDGLITWEGGPARTPSLPSRYTFFQNKATDLGSSKCAEEILEKKNLWALNKEELEINDELQNIIASKERLNELTIYSMLRCEKDETKAQTIEKT